MWRLTSSVAEMKSEHLGKGEMFKVVTVAIQNWLRVPVELKI